MKKDQLIKQALSEIAREGTNGYTDPWPLLRDNVERPNAHSRIHLSRRLVILLSAIAIITTAACAYYFLMDSGLKKADEAGLVAHLNQTAAPTVFSAVPTDLSPTKSVSQTQNGITVTLDWAYADELRVAWQLTVSGLSVPKGAYPGDFICNPHVTTKEGIGINPYIVDSKDLQDQPGTPYVFSYVSYQKMNASQYDHLNITLDLTVGPCARQWNFDQAYVGPGPTVTPVPLIGTYQLKFQVPVSKGVTITPNQVVEVNGVKMRLESLTTTPSYSLVRLCYAAPPIRDLAGQLHNYWVWSMQGVTIQTDDGTPIQPDNGNYLHLAEYDKQDPSEHCGELGFNVPIDPQSDKIVVTVASFEEDEPENIFSNPIAQANAINQLAQQGIKIQFDSNGSIYWKMIQKPSGMTVFQADQIIYSLLNHEIAGPWIFTIDR